MRIELVDAQGKVVSSASSSGDGYYLLNQVIPGRYRLRIAPDQAAQLRLAGELDRPLDVPADGSFISGVDLLLRMDRRE